MSPTHCIPVAAPARARRPRWFAAALLALVFVLGPALFGASTGLLKVHMLVHDDGRNDSFIVELPNGERMVIDNMHSSSLLAKLSALGIGSIKYLVGTHKHVDHIGGFNNFLNSGFTINNTKIYYPKGDVNAAGDDYNWMVNAAASRGLTVQKVVQNDYLLNTTYNGLPLAIRVLSPVDWRVNGGSNDYPEANDASLVLKVIYGSKYILFMGDAHEPTEIDLVNTVPSALYAQVIKVGHHGIKDNGTYALSDAFMAKVNPSKALVTNGYHDIALPEVYALQDRDITYWSTGQYGTPGGDVMLSTDGSANWTSTSAPYWQPGDTGPTYYTCTHKASGQFLHPSGSDVSFVDPQYSGYNNRWALVSAGSGYYYIQNMVTGQKVSATTSGSDVTMASGTDTSDNVKWLITDIDGTWKYLDHKASGQRLHASSTESWLVRLTSPAYTGDNVRWKLTVVPLGS